LSLGLLAPATKLLAAESSGSPATSQPRASGGSGSQAKKPAARKPAQRAPAKRTSQQTARARQQAAARARAAARAQELREAAIPRYRLTETGEVVPDVRAEAAIIYNPITHQVLWETNSQDLRSIASITKVMTAVVFLEDGPDLSRVVVVHPSDVHMASVTFLRPNERVSVGELLHLTLIASDNGAARALARVSPHGRAAFIDRMNEKAVELGLESTRYADPSGLNPANMSSAYDMARLIAFASADERIAPIMLKSAHTVRTDRRTFAIRSTNRLLDGGEISVRGGKTGFITKAGYCLATLLQLPQGDQIAVVVLGAGSNAARFMETRHLVNWLTQRTQDLFTTRATLDD
jgi:serine-type D-Ala-D-Ala endopeptidase (penicillin-binding protein 7)